MTLKDTRKAWENLCGGGIRAAADPMVSRVNDADTAHEKDMALLFQTGRIQAGRREVVRESRPVNRPSLTSSDLPINPDSGLVSSLGLNISDTEID